MRRLEECLPLAWFFGLHPTWYEHVKDSQSRLKDDISYSAELWEDICEFILFQIPRDKDDPLWDELLVEKQMLRKFSKLKQLGFFK